MSFSKGLSPNRFFFQAYDLVSTSYVYQVYGTPTQGWGGIKTSGSSTTITSVSGLAVPAFSGLGVGDILGIRIGGTGGTVVPTANYRRIVTYTDADTIVVDTAINIGTSGTSCWEYMKLRAGTTAEDGWLHVGDKATLGVALYAPTLGQTDGVDVVVQGRGGHELSSDAIAIYSTQILQSAAGYSDVVIIAENINFIRVGLRAHTASTGTDSISAYLVSRAVA